MERHYHYFYRNCCITKYYYSVSHTHVVSAMTKYKMSPSSWAVSCHYVFFLIAATTNNHKLSGLWLRIFVSFCRIRNPIQIKVSRELFSFQEGLEKFSFLAFSSIETTCISWLREGSLLLSSTSARLPLAKNSFIADIQLITAKNVLSF